MTIDSNGYDFDATMVSTRSILWLVTRFKFINSTLL